MFDCDSWRRKRIIIDFLVSSIYGSLNTQVSDSTVWWISTKIRYARRYRRPQPTQIVLPELVVNEEPPERHDALPFSDERRMRVGAKRPRQRQNSSVMVVSVMMRQSHVSGQSGEESVRTHHSVAAGSGAHSAAATAAVPTGHLMAATPMRRQVHGRAIVTDRQAHYIPTVYNRQNLLATHCLALTDIYQYYITLIEQLRTKCQRT